MAWPTTSNPRTEFVTLRLTKEEAHDLDTYLAPLHGGNRSAAARVALEKAIVAARRRAKKRTERGAE